MDFLSAISKPLLELDSFKAVLEDLKNDITPILVSGVIDVQWLHVIGAVIENIDVPAVIVAENDFKAKEIYDDLKFFVKNVRFYPSRDLIFYDADVHSKETEMQRAGIINSLLENERLVAVMSVESLMDRKMRRADFEKYVINIEEAQVLDIDGFIEKLILMGYERTDLVEGAGQFSVRGGIIDIYSPVEETAARIEMWDDEIDSIRTMDTNSQRSMERVKSVKIFPIGDVVYGNKELEKAVGLMEKEYKKTRASFEKKGMDEEAEKLDEHVGEDIQRLKTEKYVKNIAAYIQYFYEDTGNILDYFAKDTILFLDDPQRLMNQAQTAYKRFEESIKSRILKGYVLKREADNVFNYTDIVKISEGYRIAAFTTISKTISYFNFKDIIPFYVKSTASFNNHTDLFCDEVKSLKENGYSIVVLTSSMSRGERMVKELLDKGVAAGFSETLEKIDFKPGGIYISKGSLSRGFEYRDIKFAVYSDHEIFDGRENKKPKKKNKNTKTIQSFTDLKVGDYVVHQSHGIGVFRGLEKITVDGANKDYMKISYADGGSLFIPVSQMDAVQKYIGSDSEKVRLNKLGGHDWNKAKAKVRAAVKILAEDLIAVYAKRRAAVGFVYSEDNLWQKEFEETFPYTETDDQLMAIEDVKKDMQSPRVMDRLICGDVGYGKTEVAIRAAFKAVQDNKQVAYLVPTTILAQQHYNTFVSRMRDYPIKVELMSRFRTPKQQKQTIKDLEQGFADIVIGTHRILSKDVKFKDLGLVIIDEEQRFGVAHKEKMKAMKENLDVLTLTATPIPRTLHMSLSGIRDMSILEEPPLERHPVQTYVMESDPEFIKDAILREISRGGQVYFLYNRVDGISQTAFKIQELVPQARVSFAHGQMTERELEVIMKDFIEGEIDVLVCTTIIETGLDIPNANTIIIQDADRMGLSQLYQLRGRVGRSNRMAYAYLMYRKNKILNEVSEKRLQTIKEFTEFGSGFKIAMRDLEIRGAGNLLGAEQHGHMEAVGYDMYCRLLDEAVKELRGEKIEEEFETMVDLNVNAYIPPFYIKNEEQKLEIYKKISLISNKDDYFDVQEEIEDRYGNIPKSVQMLLEIVMVKNDAHSLDILSIVQKQANIVVTFKGDAKINPAAIVGVVAENPRRYLFTSATNPYITIKTNENEGIDSITYVKIILERLKEIQNL